MNIITIFIRVYSVTYKSMKNKNKIYLHWAIKKQSLTINRNCSPIKTRTIKNSYEYMCVVQYFYSILLFK